MNASLLFLNALSAQINPQAEAYVREEVQAFVANLFDLPLHVVQNLWLDVDLTQVRQRFSRETLPSMQEALQRLFGQTAWMWLTPLEHWHVVLVVPEQHHVDKIFVLKRETAQMTGGQNPALVLLKQDYEKKPHLLCVIPEWPRDPVFLDALLQTRGEREREQKHL